MAKIDLSEMEERLSGIEDNLSNIAGELNNIAHDINKPLSEKRTDEARHQQIIQSQLRNTEIQKQLVREIRFASKDQNKMYLWHKGLIIATIILGIISLFMAYQTSAIQKESLGFQYRLYAWNFNVDIYSPLEVQGDVFVPAISVPSSRVVSNLIQIPVRVRLNNWGFRSVYLKKIRYKFDCGKIFEDVLWDKGVIVEDGEDELILGVTTIPYDYYDAGAKKCELNVFTETETHTYQKVFRITEVKLI